MLKVSHIEQCLNYDICTPIFLVLSEWPRYYSVDLPFLFIFRHLKSFLYLYSNWTLRYTYCFFIELLNLEAYY